MACNAGRASKAECGELRLAEKGSKIQILDGKGGGDAKIEKIHPKNVRQKVKICEKTMGSERNLKITKEAGDSVAEFSNGKQGVGNQGKGVCIPMKELKYDMKSMSEWNDECVVTIEKRKKKRVLSE